VIRDDADARRVVITFPAALTPEMVKLLRCSGFTPKVHAVLHTWKD
jgi:hypothetical protein